MSETGLSAFDTTLNKTQAWLRQIMQELSTADRHRAYSVLRSTLHAVRDRLPLDQAIDFGAQLPMLVRGIYYEGWKPNGSPRRDPTLSGFLCRIRRDLPHESEAFVEHAAHAVFHVLAEHLTAGEIRRLRYALPDELGDLWN